MEPDSFLSMLQHLQQERCDAVLQITIDGEIGSKTTILHHIRDLSIDKKGNLVIQDRLPSYSLKSLSQVKVYTILSY